MSTEKRQSLHSQNLGNLTLDLILGDLILNWRSRFAEINNMDAPKINNLNALIYYAKAMTTITHFNLWQNR